MLVDSDRYTSQATSHSIRKEFKRQAIGGSAKKKGRTYPKIGLLGCFEALIDLVQTAEPYRSFWQKKTPPQTNLDTAWDLVGGLWACSDCRDGNTLVLYRPVSYTVLRQEVRENRNAQSRHLSFSRVSPLTSFKIVLKCGARFVSWIEIPQPWRGNCPN